MRILIVTEDMPAAKLGGAGKHAVTLANALLAAGHDVEMLGALPEAGCEHEVNGFKGRVHRLIDFSHTGWKQVAMGVYLHLSAWHMARRVWGAVQRVGLDWDVIHYHGHVPLVGALAPPHLNFVHTLHDQGAECVTKLRFRNGAPCTATAPRDCAGCHAASPNLVQTAVTGWSVQQYRLAAVQAFTRHPAVFVSKFMADRFRRIAGDPPSLQTHVVHNFTDADVIRSQVVGLNAPARGDRPRIFMAGRITAEKGFSALLAALPDAAFERLDITVAGHGNEYEALVSRYQPRGVRFAGWQDLGAVLRCTAVSDACVVPSIWEEPFGTTVLEALALGRPVYALRRGGNPEMVRYTQWPQQLRLFDDIPALAAAVADAGFGPPPGSVNDLADVRQRLPEILAVYRSRPFGRVPTAAHPAEPAK